MWKIKCYTSSSGKNEIKDWYDDNLDKKEKVTVFNKMEKLSFLPKNQWTDPFAHKLVNGEDIYSIRLKGNQNKQYRILGFFIEDKKEFIMLNWFVEKSTKSDYANALDKAKQRKKEVIENAARTVEYYFTTG